MILQHRVTPCCCVSEEIPLWSGLITQIAVKANCMSFLLQDVFSAGCVIAETFLDGKPLFDYAAVRKELLLLMLLQSVLMASVAAPQKREHSTCFGKTCLCYCNKCDSLQPAPCIVAPLWCLWPAQLGTLSAWTLLPVPPALQLLRYRAGKFDPASMLHQVSMRLHKIAASSAVTAFAYICSKSARLALQ